MMAFPLAAAFLAVLKLTHVIRWSWWWVATPVWSYFLLAAVIFAVGFPSYSRRQAKSR
jgi:hypothetical protein